jgi:transcriptional regulator with XRE-family HTH domain
VSVAVTSAARRARLELGSRLREVRRRAGLTGRALAAATGWHFTRVSKIENGVQVPTEADIRDWCRVCDADELVGELLATAGSVDTAYVELHRQARTGLRRLTGAHTTARYEQTKLFRIYEHHLIPVLLQTAEYATAVLSFWQEFLETPNDVEAAVAARMARQQVLYHGGRRFAVLLEEQALRTLVGPLEIQIGRLDRLLAVMSLPSVSLGIVPLMAQRRPVASTGFWIFDETAVALETPTASIEVTRPQELKLYLRMFDLLAAAAVYGQAARTLMGRALEDLQPRVPDNRSRQRT